MWILVLIVFASVIYLFGIKPYKYWKEKGVSCTKSWPFLGHLGPNILKQLSIAYVVDHGYTAFPKSRYIGFYMLTSPTLMIRDPDLIKMITVKEFETFPDHRQFISEDADPLWSKNLFAMRGGEKWHEMRATLSPTFTSSKMRMMFGLMKECSKQFIEHLQKENGTVTLEMKQTFTRYTNDVIATTAFGISCNSLKDIDDEFYRMGRELTGFTTTNSLIFFLHTVSPTLAKLFNIRLFSDRVKTFFRGIIKETVRVRDERNIIRPDMIHLLMEARKGRLTHEDETVDSGFAVAKESHFGKNSRKMKKEISDEDIASQALLFFFAGFETVSTMMSYAAYELAINPDVQDRLRQEIEETLEEADVEISYEKLLGMKYLDMVITETLRKWPPALVTNRKSVKPFIIEPKLAEEAPLYLKANSECFIPIYSIHRDPKYYPEPDKFDPERFSEENKHKLTPYTYLPFGAGPRNCIGSRFALLEGKLIITEIVRKFEIVPVQETEIPIKFSKKNFTSLPENGFWLGLKPRIVG